MTPGRAAALLVLMLLVALFAIGVLLGFGQDSGGSGPSSKGGLTDGLGSIVVQPAGASDLKAVTPGCVVGQELALAAHGACAYDLSSGFLGKRLRLVVVAGLAVDATVTQKPSPEVSDQQTLALGKSHDFIYRQERSQLALVCQSVTPCRVRVG